MIATNLEPVYQVDPLEHRKLVKWIALKYMRRGFGLGILIDDLIQEGMVGLLRACREYDPKKGTKFSTYAYPCIRHEILTAIANQGRTVRVPIHILELLRKEEAGELDKASLTRKTLRGLLLAKEQQTEFVGESADASIYDIDVLVYDDLAIDMDESMLTIDKLELLHEAIDQLGPREALILKGRYGIDIPETETLAALAKTVGVTRERVRQIEIRAVEKLKAFLGQNPRTVWVFGATPK